MRTSALQANPIIFLSVRKSYLTIGFHFHKKNKKKIVYFILGRLFGAKVITLSLMNQVVVV